jgi:hypothetical protein
METPTWPRGLSRNRVGVRAQLDDPVERSDVRGKSRKARSLFSARKLGFELALGLGVRYDSYCNSYLRFVEYSAFGSGEPAAPRRQSLLRSQARYALFPAATPGMKGLFGDWWRPCFL